jgi:hypothetical protein
MTKPSQLLGELLDQVKMLPNRDDIALDEIRRRAEMYIRNIFGETSKYLNDLNGITFHPMVYPADPDYYQSSWSEGVANLGNPNEYH